MAAVGHSKVGRAEDLDSLMRDVFEYYLPGVPVPAFLRIGIGGLRMSTLKAEGCTKWDKIRKEICRFEPELIASG